MKLLQVIQKILPKHKYAINAALLGDSSEYAWSNLGFWQEGDSYPQACQNLADHLIRNLNLNSKDRLLDLGVGYGASILYWRENYLIENIQAIELQENYVKSLKEKELENFEIVQESYLNLKHIPFKFKFDVIVCLDSAYHCSLNLFLDSVTSVLNSKGRIGFHTLILSEKWNTLTTIQKQQYTWLLKSADIKLKNLNSKQEIEINLMKFEFKQIEIEDLSKSVLLGFSNYVEQQLICDQKGIDYFKIKMTAKLCHKLFKDGFVLYVQVTAKQ